MAEYRRLPGRVRDWFRSSAQIRTEVDEEIAFHLEMRTTKLMAAGMTRAAAEARAQREFGDATSLRRDLVRHDDHAARRARVSLWWDDLRQDVRFALRSFRRAPVFTAVALCTLVLGIGASVSMFTVVNTVLLRPLPYAEPDRLVRLWPGHNFNMTLAEAIGGNARSLRSWTGISYPGVALTGHGEAVQLRAQAVDAGFFDVFSVQLQRGRAFTPEERDPGKSGVVVLSDRIWRTRFGADPDIIGRRVTFDGYGHQSREVVGIMPPDFVPPVSDGIGGVDVWVPQHVAAGQTITTDGSWYVNNVLGRLKDDATIESLMSEVAVLLQRARSESGNVIGEEAIRDAGAIELLPSIVGDMGGSLWMLLGAVALVLLLACANLANLLLARGERRRSELAARAALGGTRARLVRELLTESAVLATIGCAGGLLLAQLVLNVLRVAETSGLPRTAQLGMDLRVVLFAVAVSTGALLLFALLPALRMTAGNLRPDMGSGRRARGVTRAGRRLGAALVAGEVALAMVLVTAAALLIQSFRSVSAVEPGIDASDMLAVPIYPSPAKYGQERSIPLYEELLTRMAALPGVRTAGAIHLLPFTQNNWGFPYLAQGHEPPADGPLPAANFRVVTGDYFDAADVQLLAGRTFTASDGAGSDALIINHTMAERLWPGEDAVGKEIRLFGNTPLHVIGVVEDVHQHALDAAPEPEMYRALPQFPVQAMIIMLETDGDPAALMGDVRRTVAAVDPDIPIGAPNGGMQPLQDVLGESLAQRRFFAGTLTFFGLLALTLGAVGVYGVMSYAVSARMSEFSVRIALGATHASVLRNALRTGLTPVLAGALAGIFLARQAAGLLESLLFGVQPRDPRVLAVAAVVLVGTAALATWLPARRVRRVEPISLLSES